MQEDISKEDVISRPVVEMLTVAHEYCLFYEQTESVSAEAIWSFFQKIAPLLYLKGATLPPFASADPQYLERFVTEEQWEAVFKPLKAKFDSQDTYYTHDHNFDSQPASLAENMADIYQDMKDFVLLIQKAHLQGKASALAEFQQLYQVNWGPKLLGALQAVHQLLFSKLINSPLTDEENPLDFEDWADEEWED